MIYNAIITLILVWSFMASVYTGVMFLRQKSMARTVEMIYNATMFKPNHANGSVDIALPGCCTDWPDYVNIKLHIGRDKIVRIIYDVGCNEARCYVEKWTQVETTEKLKKQEDTK